MPPPYHPLENFQSLSEANGQVVLRTDRGSLELTPAGPGALRVRFGQRQRLPAYHSPAVTQPIQPVSVFQLEPAGDSARLRCDGVVAHIQFSPLRLSFAAAEGAPLMTQVQAGARGEYLAVRAAARPNEHVYGLGEKTGWLDKRHRRYRMRNSDVLLDVPEGIGAATDPLYASFPVFAVHSQAGSYGVFVDNTEFTTFDFTHPGTPASGEGAPAEAGWYEFAAPAKTLTFYVLAGPTLPDLLRQYTALTGRLALPPLWALGYHQCRWGYRTEEEFRAVAEELRARRIPADALWFDIDYMDGYRVFTWNRRRFSQPARLIADLKAQGLRSVTIVDPGVKVDPNYAMYQEGQAGGHFVKHPDGREYNGNAWPGLSAFPDFHRPETRAWWAEHVRRWQAESGVAGVWNDMNEPASTDVTGPLAEVLHGGGRLPHPAARNTYGLEMARATQAGLLAHDPEARPFILTRAAFSGAQAVTALWGGDNSPLWEHLSGSLPMLLNLGLSGMPFVGVDIGGFAGDTHAELLARWFEAGAFYPFCRNHAMAGTNAHEPWAFGPQVEAIARRYLELRYQLLPYLYNLFYQAAQTGAPILRPLVWHYPNETATHNLSDQYLLGRDLLAAPVVQPGQRARVVYLPRGFWYRWGKPENGPFLFGGPRHILVDAPLEELPLFVRGGAILPMWPVAQHTGAVRRGELRLHFWPGQGQLDFYEDDGATPAYGRGEFRLTPFRWRPSGRGYALKWEAPKGQYRDERTTWRFVFHDLAGARLRLDDKSLRATREAEGLVVEIADDGKAHKLQLEAAAKR